MVNNNGKDTNSPLRSVRDNAQLTLNDVTTYLKDKGITRSISHLSLLERGKIWPSKGVVNALVELFCGKITHMDILYPELNIKRKCDNER